MLIQENKNHLNHITPLPTTNHLNRINWLDRVKGIGILFVVIGHIYVEDSYISRIIHGLNVPLFFIASGYLCTCKREWERPGKHLLIKKIHSILLPYFIYSTAVMTWLLVRFFVFHYGSFYEIVHCLADVFCLEGISVLWFLSALFIGQILFLFSMKLIKYRAKKQISPLNLTALTTILFLLFAVCAYTLSRFIEWPALISGRVIDKLILKISRILGRGIMAGTFMLIGTIIRFGEENYKKGKENRKNLILFLSLSLSIIGLWHNGLRDFHYLSFGCFPLYLLNGSLGFLSAALIGRLLSRDRILTLLGRNSLIIMATHLIFLDLINIMAIILSVPAGRYLGDEHEIKLAILILLELLLLLCRKFISNKKKKRQMLEKN